MNDINEKAARIYADCRNGKLTGVNSTEWERSYHGHCEGYRQAIDDVLEYVPYAWRKLIESKFKGKT